MNKIKVAVLFGGKSPEYSVSLHSASSALRNMPEEFEVITYGITENGDWYKFEGTIDEIEENIWQKGNIHHATLSLNPSDHGFIVEYPEGYKVEKVDVIFPIMHGSNGEDGTLAGACKMSMIPFVGCELTSAALCMDKEYTHIVADHANVPMAKWLCVRKYENHDMEELYKQATLKVGTPMIIKPCNAGSSYGVSKVTSFEEFSNGILEAYKYDNKLIIEQFMKGFEVGKAVLGNGDKLTLGLSDEIDMQDDFFNFEEKYTPKTSTIHVPARISDKLQKELDEVASTIYKALDCKGLARVDCFVVDDHIYLNELNTYPGFTGNSRYPSMMKAKGYPFKEVIKRLVDLARE